jgi:hypothetical protein
VAHQFKLLGVYRPLLYLWGAVTSDDNLKNTPIAAAAVSTLQLWGHSFHSVTIKRRENFLKLTDPRFEALLSEANRFEPEECGTLFGRSFLKQMVNEASDDQKLRSLGRSGGANGSSNSSTRPKSGCSRGSRSGWKGSSFNSGFNSGQSGNRSCFHTSRDSRQAIAFISPLPSRNTAER